MIRGMGDPPESTPNSRRGRPTAAQRERRHAELLDLAEELLVEDSVPLTMDALAGRSGASKGTLYQWFGDRSGLLAAVVRRNADHSAQAIEAALATGKGLEATLTAYALGLLRLLTSPVSIALNREAMLDPAVAAVLLENGRHRIGPLVEAYLAGEADAGRLRLDDPAQAFEVLYGLVVRDLQIRMLLGEAPPSGRALSARAHSAVADFLTLASAGRLG